MDGVAGWPDLRLHDPQGCEIPQWRAGHRRGRQILLRALPRYLARVDEGEFGLDRDARPVACAVQAEEALAGLPELLYERQRRRLDRAEEIRREGRRGRVQEGADRRGPLQIRLVQSGPRVGARSFCRLLAEETRGQTAGHESDPGRSDPGCGAEARRDRYRLLGPRRAG